MNMIFIDIVILVKDRCIIYEEVNKLVIVKKNEIIN